MANSRAYRLIAAGLAWGFGATALACPVCSTGTGQQVRAGIFGEDFGATLLATLSPFPVLALVVAALHFGWPLRKPAAAAPAAERTHAR